ncbi:D-glycero-beta-D-manno-heptose-7-phosphate kinase [Pseudodesulfovibrio sp. F-1]|uniref:D-glycero-beta-D-manno-heptose-7-phosphate kinase n=1 Tax=Pseudodesulfovibrio alkaliphilus TaxID=2661613 RepID=A0A7K1KP04_9BACT|nr:D-glycero-beta-D-manno-heptose-7-phosphate kinase [Pseudodesulfovibrio alkaliphilus]MUM77621.1 D-glycero-beta-D-manno-heptose-7-phosphate kinase [Pseudodesulfovibrio alkaliphilus]
MKRKFIREAVRGLAGGKVMIIGDLMLDHYMIGSVERISPEAPVPVVRVERETSLLGGAGNVARNIVSLGGEALLISTVGTDEDGARLDRLCNKAQLNTKLIRDPARPTTKKTRIIAGTQQVVRVDQELSVPLQDAELDQLFNHLQMVLPGFPVIVLSDYGKGFICPEFMCRFMEMVAQCDPRPMVLVDPKTVNYDLYHGVDLLTPNTKEAGEGAGLPVKGQDTVIRAGRALFDRLGCRNLLVTMGGDGMALFEGPGKVTHIPTFARKVFDVTGAGDTVIATVALALASGLDLSAACTLANYAAGIVVGQVGAATATPTDVLEAVDELPEPTLTQW